MDIKQHIQNSISEILKNNYQIENLTLEVQQNKTDFEGDFTVVIFPLVKLAKKSPDVLGNELGEELKKHSKAASRCDMIVIQNNKYRRR